jgi:superfamily II DNA or RNA helicase
MPVAFAPDLLAGARRRIARAILSAHDEFPPRLGGVELRPHQRVAASRLASLIVAHGGAMLAEPVGVGKTYTALAVAARLGGELLVVAPASLRSMWVSSLERCGLSATFASHETLSRGASPGTRPAVVIVDEAHRVRSSTTRRYATLAALCRTSKLLLVTATPVQNRGADLAAQLALFLGRRAWQMTEEELAAYVVRDADADVGARPALNGPKLIVLDAHDDCLDQILSLPPPVPARDEGVAAALTSYGLIHQWTSSRGALEHALQRRRARALALASAIEGGRRPSRAELSAWTHADDAIQLAFPEIVAAGALDMDDDVGALRESLEAHTSAVEALLARLRASPDPDVERAAVLRRIRRDHPGERIIAFCHYAETVNALRSRLARDAGIAALTAHGARVAGGRISRDDVLEQFVVRAEHARPVPASERIDLLITTDLLSEGLNLQEASVIVHLDMPWNPARLDQRVGRALRLGSRHHTVTVYIVAPPASAERLIGIERRLRDKLRVAQRTIGVAGGILPSPIALAEQSDALAAQSSAIESVLRDWLVQPGPDAEHRDLYVAAAGATSRGFLALVRDERGLRLVAGAAAGIDASVAAVRSAVAACNGPPVEVNGTRARIALGQLADWLDTSAGEATIDFHAALSARGRRAALTRVAQTMARAPRHQRSSLAALAHAARAVATAPLAEGAERILETLVSAELPDEAWLRSIAAFAEVNVRDRPGSERDAEGGRVLALILFGPANPAL